MILSDLKSYLAERKHVPVADLAHRFEAEPDAIRGMLRLFTQKGLVRSAAGGGACGGCRKCDGAAFEIYEWTGR